MSNIKEYIKLPHTGNKAIDVIIVVLMILCIAGIIVYGYILVSNLFLCNFAKVVMGFMCGLLFLSTLKYIITYFINRQRANIYQMLSIFGTTVMISTITITNVNNILVVLAVLIVATLSLMKNDLTFIKRCFLIIIVVFVLTLVLIIFKFYFGYATVSGSNPFEQFVSVYSACRILILWILFSTIYIIRFVLLKEKYKEEIANKGMQAVLEEYRAKLKVITIAESIATIETQELKNEKARDKLKPKSKKKQRKNM